MTKIYTRIKYLVLALSMVLANLASIAFFPQKAFAAAPECYTMLNDLAVSPVQPVCDTNADGTTVYYDVAGNSKTTPTDDKCYGGTSTRSGPSELRITTYREQECGNLRVLYRDAVRDACTSTGGEFVQGSGSRPHSCRCPDGKQQSAANKQCVDPPVSNDGNDSGELETLQQRAPEGDCVSENGSELNGENCGIINLLNIIFNFVSGGVTLVVIGNIIVAGIQYSTAQGDPSAAQKAKTRIRNAVIAFIMYLSLYGFVQWLIPGGVF